MPLSTYLNLGLGELAHTKLTVEIADRTVKYPKGNVKNVLVGIDKFVFLIDFIILPHYTKDCPLKEEGKTLEEAYYTQFGAPFQGGGYRAAAPGFYQRNNTNPLYQEQKKSMEETLSKLISESTKRHKENANMIKEIRTSTNAAIMNQRALIKTLEMQIEQRSKVLQERRFGSDIPSKTNADAKVAIQEMVEYSQKWHNGTSRTRSTETSDGLAAIQAQLNNLGR
nr:putative retrotransposon Gag domain, ribonuclease H-like domain protein [Tanacetum cinerariifolium]